ncbi:carbohydrate ABC transporter permease [Aquamicrobium sp. NLF2-7]|uniref:Multiple sugar transport system permease protein n=1 Tax=Aquamicrobium lusatiense TaxID=89772 RepID=A0A7W9S4N9_9HYPH|nr:MULTISPECIES: carbohydrate ABC transporter permease [Aquamicrobium]MBB6014052.1 multiple sugar transport system permease protein [Aquamicrobium lusatiense]MCG8273651.1 carbohydrate ABC transporter permease [Aquamicrobium sp. NLF2-7]
MRRPFSSSLMLHLALVLCALVVIAPIVWTVGAGFRTQISLLMGHMTFTPIWNNFNEVLWSKTSDFLLNYRNSIIVGVLSTLLCVVVATLAAFSLNRLKWPGWVVHIFLAWTMIFHMIPPVALASAWFTMARAVGLENTFTGLILAHATLNLPIAIWLMAVFIREVPKELEEAAVMDGASTPRVLWHVVLPLITPGLAATSILTFISSWNEFAVALTMTMKQTATVPVAIAKFAQDYEIQYTQMAASAALAMLPALVVLLIAQRYIVRGLTQGAVK